MSSGWVMPSRPSPGRSLQLRPVPLPEGPFTMLRMVPLPCKCRGRKGRNSQAGEADAGERAADGAVDDVHVRPHLAGAFEHAIVAVGVDAAGHLDRPFDRLDDVGEADLPGRPGQPEAAAGAARGGQQAGGGQAPRQLLRGGQRNPGLLGEHGRRQPRPGRMPGGGGHHHDGIIGKAGQTHICSTPNRSDSFRIAMWPYREPKASVVLTRSGTAVIAAAMALYPLLRPLAFALDAERAHRLTIAALKLLPPGLPARPDPRLAIDVAGLSFPNPVGLAAGFDKDAEIFRQMLGFGFGFVEVGTLTPRPQTGNPKPRLFRLGEDRAVINRMGFNNGGFAAARVRLETAGWRLGGWVAHNLDKLQCRGPGLIRVNIGG